MTFPRLPLADIARISPRRPSGFVHPPDDFPAAFHPSGRLSKFTSNPRPARNFFVSATL